MQREVDGRTCDSGAKRGMMVGEEDMGRGVESGAGTLPLKSGSGANRHSHTLLLRMRHEEKIHIKKQWRLHLNPGSIHQTQIQGSVCEPTPPEHGCLLVPFPPICKILMGVESGNVEEGCCSTAGNQAVRNGA